MSPLVGLAAVGAAVAFGAWRLPGDLGSFCVYEFVKRSQITVDGVTKIVDLGFPAHEGCFDTIEEAIEVAQDAERGKMAVPGASFQTAFTIADDTLCPFDNEASFNVEIITPRMPDIAPGPIPDFLPRAGGSIPVRMKIGRVAGPCETVDPEDSL